MKFIFLIVAIPGFLYFILKKRQFDLFSVVYISSLFYFLPGFYGHVLNWTSEGKRPYPLLDQTYLIFITFLILVISFTVLYDLFFIKIGKVRSKTIKYDSITYKILLILAVIGFLLTLSDLGRTLLESKAEIYEKKGRSYNIWVYASLMGLIVAYIYKQSKYIFFFAVLLILDIILIANRTFSVISILTVLFLFLSNRKKIRLIKYWKIGLLFTIISIFFFGFAFIRTPMKQGNWPIVKNVLLRPKFISHAINYSEPFTTQSILNQTISTNFKSSPDQISSTILSLVPLSTELGLEVKSFIGSEQNLFGNFLSLRSLAGNFWAQMYSIGGFLFVVFVIIFYCILLIMGNILIRRTEGSLKGIISIIFIFFSFYIHRNDLASIVSIERRLIYIYFVIVFLIFLIQIISLKSNIIKK